VANPDTMDIPATIEKNATSAEITQQQQKHCDDVDSDRMTGLIQSVNCR